MKKKIKGVQIRIRRCPVCKKGPVGNTAWRTILPCRPDQLTDKDTDLFWFCLKCRWYAPVEYKMKPEFRKTLLYVSEKSGEEKKLKCIIAIIIDAETREVLMHGFIDQVAWDKTQETKVVHFWSTSRDELWRKGATSGNEMKVIYQFLDCDCDAVVIGVKIQGNGVACHTGKRSCFYNKVS